MMSKNRELFYVMLMVLGTVSLFVNGFPGSIAARTEEKQPLVYQLNVDGTINPALADYIVKGIEKAEEANANAVVITMDTPGGVVTTTKSIIKDILNAKIPIVVYVSPSGSSASSAGALITMAADIAAMAPGTNIGAAHPVGGGGQKIDETMSEKVVNDLSAYMRGIVAKKGRNAEWAERSIRESVSITAKEALESNVIDVVADSVPDLLEKIDGRTVEKDGRSYVLHTKNAKIVRVPTGTRFKILDVIANPNVAYVLLMIGGLGIMMELYNPGLIFPGVVGGISLLLAFFALQVLPVNYVGIMLIILAVILFILELKVTSFGLLSVGGIISLTLGSVMLFETGESAMRVSWSVIIPTVFIVSAFFIFALGLAMRAWMRKPRTGEQGIVGEIGYAISDVNGQGKVAVHGEYWNARSDTHIPKGERIRVLRMENLSLVVTRFMSN
ncbi:NfeD family protein [Desulfomonile tiedjei]|uniref:Membrane-bound serine protease (ClpP class) n=1 Tax=Desulfomonile tiedjei (strain ATCC 49306 / DSM 6799 / DCB-1) TaxID=706587 RepID=I4CBR5_DESTA|nr:nodulation protein NfeD [Desulfomonile tiedjei]AFM27006.1 membrane-bound serine protease (ClpP class) [Desulfomonile tiedjei DSM 6799]